MKKNELGGLLLRLRKEAGLCRAFYAADSAPSPDMPV